MQTHCKFTVGLLVAGLLLAGSPAVNAQTTTKVKSKPNKGTVVKEKTEDGQKTKTKSDEDGLKVKSNTTGTMSGAGTSGSGTMQNGSMSGSGNASGTGAGTMQDGSMQGSNMSGRNVSGGAAGVMVGGAMMIPSRDIVDNAALSQDHTTLVSAVKQAGLVQTLKGAGPFTVFAPTNAAFTKLPTGTVDNLMTPQGSTQLTSVLTYHVVPGRFTAADLKDGQILTTVQGQTLTVMKTGNQLMLRDGKGMTVNVTTPDVISSNGVTHVVDGVLMPSM